MDYFFNKLLISIIIGQVLFNFKDKIWSNIYVNLNLIIFQYDVYKISFIKDILRKTGIASSRIS